MEDEQKQLPPGLTGGQEECPQSRPQYSIPGILHFIQHEWSRFELERAQWEVERTELQTRIAFLQGERKGQECLKNDLVRRIKMLEYALRQERGRDPTSESPAENRSRVKSAINSPQSKSSPNTRIDADFREWAARHALQVVIVAGKHACDRRNALRTSGDVTFA
ncbi:striatin-3-like [Tropilaelaps mercedesae]|uniref:Striatin-3-like n=1 Tax=Tropilaelaps mercedesae TaxID=418985 RepID=A0A1V9X9I2_9ACAR|nr:striatin-3-like [Tropilaelaps mercedesae]